MGNSERRSQVGIPPQVKEIYTQIFNPPTPSEALYPQLYEKLIHEETDRLVEALKDHVHYVKSAAKGCLGRLKIHPLQRRGEEEKSLRILASDAGNNGVDLRGCYVPLCAAAAVLTEGWCMVEEPMSQAPDQPEIWVWEERQGEKESLLAFKLQCRVTEKVASADHHRDPLR